MSDQVQRRTGGRSARVREAVLAAAVELIAETGPAGFSIAEVAARAEVHETSIYRRWGTRERLTIDALLQHSAALLKVPDTGTLKGDLVELGEALVRYGDSPIGEALERTMASATDDDESAVARVEFWDARHGEVQVLINRAKERGEVPEATDGRLLVEMFIAPIHFRLLLTREPVDAAFLGVIAGAVIAGVALVPE